MRGKLSVLFVVLLVLLSIHEAGQPKEAYWLWSEFLQCLKLMMFVLEFMKS